MIARQLATRDRVSLDEALSRLARNGARTRAQTPVNAICKSKYAVLPARTEVINLEHVRRLMDEERI